MRTSMKPDEAFGMIFDLEGVITDTKHIKKQAWHEVARQQGFNEPTDHQLTLIMDMRLERAITEVLRWTRDWGKAKELAWQVAAAYGSNFTAISEPQPGIREWLHALSKSNVPCAIVTAFDRNSVRPTLERLGLLEFFIAMVTAEDGMETKSQRFLSAAIKMGRPPNHCVVFDSCLAGITAAHNCTMKAVAVQGRHLQTADLSVVSLSELAVYNIRRLFANRQTEFMALQQASDDQKPRLRRIRNATMD
ncbi:g1652 [Coccomyxa viridis]|uniref:G1652 protein n=1 Tax=Coccomyxa viridis TaxID=1274662 RepID=A0ABP1FQA9_9CHLO